MSPQMWELYAPQSKGATPPKPPPQPTQRDLVVAQRQAQAAAGDTPDSIANRNNIPVEDLLAANPGVVTVRPGQVLALPKPPNPFAGSQAMVGVRTTGGQNPNLGNYNTSYNGFQTPTTNGFQTPSPYAGNTGTAGYYAPYNQQQKPPATQPYMGSSSYMNPALRPAPQGGMSGDKQGQLGTTTQQPAVFPTDNKGNPLPYTGDPNDPNTAAWKSYWNASAKAGVDLAGRLSTPKVMTRDQIWEMKANQRRRFMNEANNSYSYNNPYSTPLVRNITWGI